MSVRDTNDLAGPSLLAATTNEIPRLPILCDTAELAAQVRNHWTIENRLHWVRDVTSDDDRSQIPTAGGPRATASLRNLTVSRLHSDGHPNIAQAIRHHA